MTGNEKGSKAMVRLQSCECNFCGTEIGFAISKVGELVNCQNCGMETVLFVPGIAGPYPQEQYFLQATNIGWSRTPLGFRNVVGTVINTSERHFDWVRIEFKLVNREANQVGETSDCLIGFPPKGIWTFRAPVFQAEALGVGAPLIACEYGKILVPKTVAQNDAPESAPEPPPAAESQKLVAPKVKPATNEWTGLRITGGVTGTAARQSPMP